MNKNNNVANKLPKIENAEKIKDSLILVLFCLKYIINPAKEDSNMMKVEVSIAMVIGIKKSNVINETKKTPPPTPAITASVPDKNPSKINKKREAIVRSI